MSKKPCILITACDPYLAGIYGRKFELDGWDVEVVESINEVEKKILKVRPKVILIDADCAPDISKEIEKMRKMPTILDTKIAILSSRGDKAEIQRSIDSGANTYLILGHFVPQEAVEKMRKLLKM